LNLYNSYRDGQNTSQLPRNYESKKEQSLEDSIDIKIETQEDEEKLIEERRKRRNAILEKYKNKNNETFTVKVDNNLSSETTIDPKLDVHGLCLNRHVESLLNYMLILFLCSLF
jgi:hypothetical protein